MYQIISIDNEFYVKSDSVYAQLFFDKDDMARAYHGYGGMYFLSSVSDNSSVRRPDELFSNWDKYPELAEYSDNSLVFFEEINPPEKVEIGGEWVDFKSALVAR